MKKLSEEEFKEMMKDLEGMMRTFNNGLENPWQLEAEFIEIFTSYYSDSPSK